MDRWSAYLERCLRGHLGSLIIAVSLNEGPVVGRLGLPVPLDIDGDRTNAKLQRVKKAAEHNGVDESVIVVCSDVDRMPTNADIEDLFDVADFLRLYNWVYKDNLKAGDLAGTDEPIIKKITAVRGSFDHALPAHALTLHRNEFFGAIKPKTVKQFVALAEKLNATVTI